METAEHKPGRLLVIDDEPVAAQNLAYALTKIGHEVEMRSSGPGGLDLLQRESFDVVLTDLRMERVDGMAILKRAREIDPTTAVIMITGHATLPSAVEAMKSGAFHYIAKPFRLDEVREVVRNALEVVRLKRENLALREQVDADHTGPRIITQDLAMQRLLDTATQVAPTDCNILIVGESGTGKELFARHVHARSNRAEAPFVAVNCGALQEELLANELFGHERGAFTGAHEAKAGLIESANGGTLFLDEIAEMSLGMQVKLLRVIQEREVQRLGSTRPRAVDVRFIAATLRDLRDEVASGRFRQDLFFRLDVVTLAIPPLAHRRRDIPMLAYYFLKKHALRMDRPVREIAPDALALLNDYDYPGNVRELENLVERGVALARSEELTIAELPAELRDRAVTVIRETSGELPSLEQREAEYIEWVLHKMNGNRTRAAQVLGIDRVSLWRKLKKYGLEEG